MMIKFTLRKVESRHWLAYDLLIRDANVGGVCKVPIAHWRKTPWHAWNRLTRRTVGRYRTKSEARAALERDVRATIKLMAQERFEE